jgi:hypothetical protein
MAVDRDSYLRHVFNTVAAYYEQETSLPGLSLEKLQEL